MSAGWTGNSRIHNDAWRATATADELAAAWDDYVRVYFDGKPSMTAREWYERIRREHAAPHAARYCTTCGRGRL